MTLRLCVCIIIWLLPHWKLFAPNIEGDTHRTIFLPAVFTRLALIGGFLFTIYRIIRHLRKVGQLNNKIHDPQVNKTKANTSQ